MPPLLYTQDYIMKRKYTRWTREILKIIVENSNSYADCLRQMGLVAAGGNYNNLIKNLDKFNIDTSHFLGQSHNRGKELVSYEELTKPSSIKKRLIKDRGNSCEVCGLSLWLHRPLVLELEHIDGNRNNNSKTNSLLLCPNCHSQTPTWRRRKNS